MSTELQPWQSAIIGSQAKFENLPMINGMSFKVEAAFAKQQIIKNSFLMKLANEQSQSLADSVINVAAVGLSLNPATAYAFLIPRDGRCCLDISYRGLIKIATDTGSIKWATADIVCTNDTFVYKGPTEKPDFTCTQPFDRGEVQGSYCVAKTVDGDYLTTIISIEELNKIRDLSPAYSRSQSGPWVTFPDEMRKKVVIKRASKTWPKTSTTGRLETAIEVVNQIEGIDFSEDRKLFDLFMERLSEIHWSERCESYHDDIALLAKEDALLWNPEDPARC